MEMDGGAQASARPIYQYFVSTAKKLNPNYLSFIIPARWYAGGKGLDDFRDEMLNDTHLKMLYDCLTPEQIFPNTNIRGGVCYFLWDKVYDNSKNLTEVITLERGKLPKSVTRPLKIDGLDIFIRHSEAISILNKVFSDNNIEILAKHISPRKPFGIDSSFVKSSNYHSSNLGLLEPVICYGKGKQIGYIEKSKIFNHNEWVNAWKVCTPRANNVGTELNDDNLNTFIAAPNTICTESYILIGMDLNLNEEQCGNICKYLSTKFARFLHSLAKSSQDATAKTYRFVPMQDFSKSWTDSELYLKYGLSKEEIAFIESIIKPMD